MRCIPDKNTKTHLPSRTWATSRTPILRKSIRTVSFLVVFAVICMLYCQPCFLVHAPTARSCFLLWICGERRRRSRPQLNHVRQLASSSSSSSSSSVLCPPSGGGCGLPRTRKSTLSQADAVPTFPNASGSPDLNLLWKIMSKAFYFKSLPHRLSELRRICSMLYAVIKSAGSRVAWWWLRWNELRYW
jgi:hypothetical protein